ncbi:MAG: hypothetical protein K8R68_04765 [Bacteroidales bacterium]|nr:hypothetical protein [Bacteroidales bacterium]
MESTKLVPLVRNICECCYSPGEVTEFINISQKIAISYLKYLEHNGRNIRCRNYDGLNELEDVAIDCIAGLFMRNKDGEFVQLRRYFGNEIESDAVPSEMLISSMLKRLIVKKTKQELSRVFKERDPEGAKIIRNIKVAIRNSDKFDFFKEMGRDFVYLQPDSKLAGKKNNFQIDSSTIIFKKNTENNSIFEKDIKKHTIPEKILFQYFLEKYIPSDSISTMLGKMMEIVISLPEYQNYLAMDSIAAIIREVTFQHAHEKLSNNVDTNSPLHDLQTKEIDQVNKSVIKFIRKKIHQQYLGRKKVTPGKTEIYCRAISDFVNELTQGKETDSNFQYLKRYLPGLTQESYREEERSVFEYLIKITKKVLRNKLRELL